MKKIIGSIFVTCFAVSAQAKNTHALCTNVIGTNFTIGNGSFTNPYILCNQEQFLRLSMENSLLSKHFKLGADLNFKDYTLEVIGSPTNPFQGAFDGDGYSISHITVRATESKQFVGLFGYTKNSKIENLTINDISIPDFADSTGGSLIGKAENTRIINVSIHNLEMKASKESGGLIGYAVDSRVYKTAVDGTMYQNSQSNINGGLVGKAENSEIFSAYANVKMIQTSATASDVSNIGGLVGVLSTSILSNVYSMGKIDYSSVGVSNEMLSPQNIAGLIGTADNSMVSYAYFAGTMNVLTEQLGGIVATSIDSIFSNVYWDVELSGVATSAAGESIVTSLLKQASFWQAKGFSEQEWELHNGDYPKLIGLTYKG